MKILEAKSNPMVAIGTGMEKFMAQAPQNSGFIRKKQRLDTKKRAKGALQKIDHRK